MLQEVSQTTPHSQRTMEHEREVLKASTSHVGKKHGRISKNINSENNPEERTAADSILRDQRQVSDDQTKWKKNVEMVMKAALRANVLTFFLLMSRFPAHLLNIIHVNCYFTSEGCDNFLGNTKILGGIRIIVMILHPLFVLTQIKKIQPPTRD